MGVVPNVSFDKFPKQGRFVGMEARVCFHYDLSKTLKGKIIRDDVEAPFETLIQLENGNVIRSVECQYSPKED